jgi:hypothetical protein
MRMLICKRVAFDTHIQLAGVSIPQGTLLSFFRDVDYLSNADITKKAEEEVIKWILASPARNLFLSELVSGLSPFIDYSVKQPVIENPQNKPGDIDILICPANRPDIAIAFQCKPVVVKALNEEEDDDPRKLPKLTDLVIQANEQRNKLGFYRNYLAVLILVDGRKKITSNTLFRGTNPETFQKIYEFPDREKVHKDVGIIFIEIAQPAGKTYDQQAVVDICFDREAVRLNQIPHLTNRIEDLMRQKGVTKNRT